MKVRLDGCLAIYHPERLLRNAKSRTFAERVTKLSYTTRINIILSNLPHLRSLFRGLIISRYGYRLFLFL